MSLISADAVSVVRNGTSLLHDVSLEVDRGEVLGIVGPNGAGKSTLLRVLAGDLEADGGSAYIDGHAVQSATLSELARLRAVVGPQSSSDIVFRVGDVVAMARHADRTGVDSGVVSSAMARVDVDHLYDRAMRTLSSGEQQRVHLARAIAQQTPVILLDEPTSALDVGHQELVMNVLRSLADEGAAVVSVLHDLNLGAVHTDRLLLLDGGRTLASGTPRQVLTSARLSSAYQEAMEVIDHPFRDCPLVLTTGR